MKHVGFINQGLTDNILYKFRIFKQQIAVWWKRQDIKYSVPLQTTIKNYGTWSAAIIKSTENALYNTTTPFNWGHSPSASQSREKSDQQT